MNSENTTARNILIGIVVIIFVSTIGVIVLSTIRAATTRKPTPVVTTTSTPRVVVTSPTQSPSPSLTPSPSPSPSPTTLVTTQLGALSTGTVAEDTTTLPANEQLNVIQISPPPGFVKDVNTLFNSGLSLVLVVAALLVLFYLVTAGLKWITSGGEKGKTESARNQIVAAVVGLIILAASFAVLTLLLRFLGFRDLNDVFNGVQKLDSRTMPATTVIPAFSPVPPPSPSPSPSPTPSPTPVLRILPANDPSSIKIIP